MSNTCILFAKKCMLLFTAKMYATFIDNINRQNWHLAKMCSFVISLDFLHTIYDLL